MRWPPALLLLAVLACTDAPAAGPPASNVAEDPAGSPAAAEGGATEEPLALAPADAGEVAFTDWATIRADLGLTGVTGTSDFGDKSPVLRATLAGHAAPSAFAQPRLATFADVWGWDTFDALWEATVVPEGLGPGHVVHLRDGVDVEGILARYDERGFERRESGGTVVLSHDLVTDDWLVESDPAVLNTAVLAERRLFLLASSPDTLQMLLEAATGEAPAAAGTPLATAVTALGDAAGWSALQGERACALRALADPTAVAGGADALQLDRLARQEALALGYRVTDDGPVGLVALAFADEATAQAQVAERERLATDADAAVQVGARPFATGILGVDRVTAEGSAVVLRGTPFEGRPSILLQSLARDDLVVAACPP